MEDPRRCHYGPVNYSTQSVSEPEQSCLPCRQAKICTLTQSTNSRESPKLANGIESYLGGERLELRRTSFLRENAKPLLVGLGVVLVLFIQSIPRVRAR